VTSSQDPSLFPIDAVPWRGALRLLRAALRRHWVTALALPLVFVTVAAVAAALLPRTYSGELRMMARRGTSVMSAISVPRRAVAPGFDAPSQGAVEIGLSRAALVAIVQHGSLRAHWMANRPALARYKEALRTRVLGPLPPEAIDDALISMLESRLRLRVQDDVISLRVTWSDAEAVPLILTQAQRAFVAERTRLDIESIEQSYEILQRASSAMLGQMEGRVTAFQVARSRALGSQAAKIPVKKTSETLTQLRDRLLERRAYREELERRKRMKRAELRTQLAQQSAELGPRHPDRIAVEQSLAVLDGDDESLAAARTAEESALRAYTARGGSLDIFDADSPSEDALNPSEARPDDDPTVIAARALLRMSADGLQDLVMRTENARIELETARAALPYKYIVTRPADRPRRPDAPNVPILLLGGLFAGLMAGVMVSLRRFIVVESARSGLGFVALAKEQPAAPVPAVA
jgi:uncharacterized protein involved in exopolysaccharide biosynthesis